MGVVQLYRDVALDRSVAVKFTRRLDDLPRVFDELRALQQLRSNHVVQIYDAIRKAPSSFEIALVEEYLPGEDLEDVRPEHGVPFLLILWQIASGLADVHEAGLIHRDIKPGNLKVGADRHIKLIDFGLTRSTGDKAQTVGFVGTDVFAAPELYADEKVTFDAKVDIYAFGATAWHLSGHCFPDCMLERPPHFAAAEINFLTAVPSMPLDVAQMLQSCLRREPDARPDIVKVRDMLARHILRDRRRALAVTATQEHRIDSNRRAIRIHTTSGHSVDIRYSGLDFIISGLSGDVAVNNMPAVPGLVLPGCCVIALGGLDRPQHRVYVTFDVSQPEILI
jgi:serine/threonine-protein kinase